MNLTGEPNVNDIVRLGKFYRDERWSQQAKLDDEMAAYMMLDNPVDVAKTTDREIEG